MIYPENRFLFTISEVAHACSVSRATLLRMEECGFLTPFRIDKNTGYRYYDAQNIAQIGQYQLLQELGLTKNEISDYYYQKVDMTDFFAVQRKKLNRLQRLLNELELRHSHADNYKTAFIELSEITCYCKTAKNLSTITAETFAYETHQEAVKKGYRILGAEPIFSFIKSDSSMPFDNDNPLNEITMCIPVLGNAAQDKQLTTYPACHAFSLIGYGDYSTLITLAQKFREEISTRKLVPTGPPRLISHVATYVGTHISPNDFCYEYVIPIQKP